MPTTKQSPCCGRANGKVVVLKGELATAARRAARAYEKGWPMERYLKTIEDAKRLLAMAEENLTNHEAEHAAD